MRVFPPSFRDKTGSPSPSAQGEGLPSLSLTARKMRPYRDNPRGALTLTPMFRPGERAYPL